MGGTRRQRRAARPGPRTALVAPAVAPAVVAAVVALLAAACATAPEPPGRLVPGPGPAAAVEATARTWPMHLVDGRWRGANALGLGDVDGDGLTDAVTNYEFDQRYVVALHPPAGEDPRGPWPTIDLPSTTARPGAGSDTEHATLADLDGDGRLDVIGAQGGHPTPFWEGFEPGVRVYWAPPPGTPVTDASAWTDGRRIPASLDAGHQLYVDTRDLDADGATDIVVGGRQLFLGGPYTSLYWLEAPADPADRRDLGAWVRHPIDADAWSAHGFRWGDLDGDGDDDLVNANADFDTPDPEDAVGWYENPGPATAADGEWAYHEITREPALEPKPGLAVADLDGDGRTDVVTQTARHVLVLRNDPGAAGGFTRVEIPKPAATQQFSRPIRVVDLDGDGRLDLVGGLVHEDGLLATDHYAVFWMRHDGDPLDPGGWTTHPIRFGPGRTMLLGAFGEKWDHIEPVDVDGDGDLDLMANSEEWWVNDGLEATFFDTVTGIESQSVVWFENTLDEPERVTTPARPDGPTVVEAEATTFHAGGALVARSAAAEDVGGWGWLQALRSLGTDVDPEATDAERRAGVRGADRPGGARFTFEVGTGGADELWARRRVPATFGYGNGGARSDSIWASLDGGPFALLDGRAPAPGTWSWVRVAEDLQLGAGRHDLTLRLAEPGYAVDQLVVAPAGWSPPSGPVRGPG